jgi:transcriptional regulator with XRE-family HTH domain
MAEINRLNAIYRSIGEKVAKFRKIRGLKQEDLAKLVEASRTSVVLIEGGNQRPPIDRLYRIAYALGCELHDLLPPVEEFFPKQREEIHFDESAQELSKKELQLLRTLLSETP